MTAGECPGGDVRLQRVAARRTVQFLLWLNPFEREALDRVVAAGGYRNASEALRHLIRREDPEGLKLELIREDMGGARAGDKAKLSVALELISLLETCVGCDASLHGPEVDLESGAPHCEDCSPEEEERAEWFDRILMVRERLARSGE